MKLTEQNMLEVLSDYRPGFTFKLSEVIPGIVDGDYTDNQVKGVIIRLFEHGFLRRLPGPGQYQYLGQGSLPFMLQEAQGLQKQIGKWTESPSDRHDLGKLYDLDATTLDNLGNHINRVVEILKTIQEGNIHP